MPDHWLRQTAHAAVAMEMAKAAVGEEEAAAAVEEPAAPPPPPTTPKKGETGAAGASDCFLSKKITNKVVTQLQVSNPTLSTMVLPEY